MSEIRDLWDSIQGVLSQSRIFMGYTIRNNKLVLMLWKRNLNLEYRDVVEKLGGIGIPESSISVYYLKGTSYID